MGSVNISQYKVLEIHYLHSKYKLKKPAMVIDEGSFYRLESIHIIDKYRIKSTEIKDNKLTLHLDTEDIVLVVELKKQV